MTYTMQKKISKVLKQISNAPGSIVSDVLRIMIDFAFFSIKNPCSGDPAVLFIPNHSNFEGCAP